MDLPAPAMPMVMMVIAFFLLDDVSDADVCSLGTSVDDCEGGCDGLAIVYDNEDKAREKKDGRDLMRSLRPVIQRSAAAPVD